MDKTKVLVCEDNEDQVAVIEAILMKSHISYRVTRTGSECLNAFDESYTCLLLDLKLPDMSGFEIFEQLRKRGLEVPVIIATSSIEVDDAIKALQMGASNYLRKPTRPQELIAAIKDLSPDRAQGKSATCNKMNRGNSTSTFSTKVKAVTDAYKLAEKFATEAGSIILYGESGTGKEEMAKFIHAHSDRSKKTFVAVNCPAIPANLFESELFGHNKGAFTGAAEKRVGKFELANGGTLLLDEVADLSPEAQSKLLRVLQERVIEPLGSSKSIPVDVKVICASSKNLQSEVDRGNFRSDLLYRLADVAIVLPPLRERKEDIPELVNIFARQYWEESGSSPVPIKESAISKLNAYNWPGNIRELRSFVRRWIIMNDSESGELGEFDESLVHQLHNKVPAKDESTPRFSTNNQQQVVSIADQERITIESALQRNEFNISKTAKDLKIGRATLYRKLKKYDLAG